MEFIFKLGFSKELARRELETVLGFTPEKSAEDLYLVSLPNLPTLNKVANRLGGLIEVVWADTKKVVWKHSAKSWFYRDRQKPYADASHGLIPPKIARQLVNITIGPEVDAQKVLLDPFCGSGTILIEAALVGVKVIGIDLSETQVKGAKKNLAWLKIKAPVLQGDATTASQIVKNKVDYIVTEPFMGKLKYKEEEIEDIAKGLSHLYLGALKDWLDLLVPGGKVVMTFPIFKVKEELVHTSKIVDHPRLSGYNVLASGLTYSKKGAEVTREIVILEKK